MIQAEITALDQVRVTYNAPIDSGTLVPGDFSSQASGAIGVSFEIDAPATFSINMSDQTDTDSELTYDGPGPDVVSPQTIGYT